MNRIEWPAAGRNRPVTAPDPARVLLEHIAAGIEKRASSVLRAAVVVAVEAPVRDGRRNGGRNLRVWRCEAGPDLRAWLAVDETAARNLLQIVLGGPASKNPTTLEHEIVGETVERMCSSAGLCWEENGPDSPPPTGDAWRSTISIDPSSCDRVRIELVAPATPGQTSPAPSRVDADRIPIPIRAALLSEPLQLGAIAAWRPGALVSLSVEGGAPVVALFAGTRSIAMGRLGSSLGRRAVQIDSTTAIP
jgi:hypothetical protein